jgi:hypothetical protein
MANLVKALRGLKNPAQGKSGKPLGKPAKKINMALPKDQQLKNKE